MVHYFAFSTLDKYLLYTLIWIEHSHKKFIIRR